MNEKLEITILNSFDPPPPHTHTLPSVNWSTNCPSQCGTCALCLIKTEGSQLRIFFLPRILEPVVYTKHSRRRYVLSSNTLSDSAEQGELAQHYQKVYLSWEHRLRLDQTTFQSPPIFFFISDSWINDKDRG